MAGRTHYIAEISEQNIGQRVTVAGWVHRRRDHGGLIFIDLRDRSGLLQIVAEPGQTDVFETLARVRGEYVMRVHGVVGPRPSGMANPELASGSIEIRPQAVEILAESKTPPFMPSEAEAVDELVRLKYRYLDLRRPGLLGHFLLRDRVLHAVRRFFHDHGFLDVETPALARSTPEGARDFLVPSRVQAGRFYALPQSPQIFKQLLMVAGFDRYYQIAKVFRDEDLRADRQPEFTQIDVEMSFMDRDQILDLMEAMLHQVFQEALGTTLEPFVRMSWRDAMRLYGSDKPDLRAGEPLCDLTQAARTVAWEVLATAPAVAGVLVRQLAPSRRQLDGWVAQARQLGAPGLLWIVREARETRSSGHKLLGAQGVERLADAAGLLDGDTLLVAAGEDPAAFRLAGQLRLEIARQLDRVMPGFKFLWVTDFPLFEWSDEEGRLVSAHHPFTMPHADDLAILEDSPLEVRSEAYDVVLNGSELASGSLRIYQPELQSRIFSVLGLSAEEIDAKFGFLLQAFQYGAPPHGGIAFGLDRLVMLMAGAKSLRDVIAFPKTARGTDPLTDAPSLVDRRQLSELHLGVTQ
ncbi:MAG: aspartate--tRNA ligase [Thermaerobacter sp.]|nr:aspartate--tRNA ligase [Thermaerobacter sp.]